MKVVTAPHYYDLRKNDFLIFLAGGITDCPDWQLGEAIPYLDAKLDDSFIIANPRRPDFDITKKEESKIQIQWEKWFLDRAQRIVFWFPGDGPIQPIALYELGKYTEKHKNEKTRIHVGADPSYSRYFDVRHQCYLEGITVYNILEQTLDALLVDLKMEKYRLR